MKKSRMAQVINLLETLNEMSLKDFNNEYASYIEHEKSILINTKNKTARMAIEQLLYNFQKMDIYVKGNTILEILFRV